MPKKRLTPAEFKAKRAADRRKTLEAARKISKKGKAAARKAEQNATKQAGLKAAMRKRLVTKKKK